MRVQNRSTHGRGRLLRRPAFALLTAVMALGLTIAPPAHAQPSQSQDTGDSVSVDISEVNLDGPRVSDVVVTVENHTDRHLRKLEVDFRGPVGWTTSRAQEQRMLMRGESTELTFQIHVPRSSDDFREHRFTATAAYDGGDGAGSVSETVTQTTGEPTASLQDAFNRVGVTALEDRDAGNFDGEGNTFSLERLAEQGVEPGGSVEAGGAVFTFPEVGRDMPDHVSGGSTILFDGQGDELVFLGSGSSFNAVGTVNVRYTDGSTSQGSIGFPNWSFQDETAHGATLAVATPGRNTPGGYANAEFDYRMFTNSIELDAEKQIEMITLPGASDVRIFDIAVAE